ncbi:MAG: hypothetical protein AABX13_04905 [Nanoarchaeota archaeon]
MPVTPASPIVPAPSVASSGTIWGFPKEVFIALLKYGALAGVISGVLEFIGSVLSSATSWFGWLTALSGLFSIYQLVSGVFWGAVWGAGTVLVVVKYYEKFPFKTLFMKFFGLALIVDVAITLLFGGFILLFAGPLSFLFLFGSLILADLVFAKVATHTIQPITRLP